MRFGSKGGEAAREGSARHRHRHGIAIASRAFQTWRKDESAYLGVPFVFGPSLIGNGMLVHQSAGTGGRHAYVYFPVGYGGMFAGLRTFFIFYLPYMCRAASQEMRSRASGCSPGRASRDDKGRGAR
ncbi:hypothetical protein QBC39DRAFT_359821 [Podospora conica]|nr:hypothetical protein QBC39DRAFT_359821 [Schizothecium conicum]